MCACLYSVLAQQAFNIFAHLAFPETAFKLLNDSGQSWYSHCTMVLLYVSLCQLGHDAFHVDL